MAQQGLKQFDVVRIISFHPNAFIGPSPFDQRAPRIGDEACIVALYEDPPGYELECSDGDQGGAPIWLRTFGVDDVELEVIWRDGGVCESPGGAGPKPNAPAAALTKDSPMHTTRTPKLAIFDLGNVVFEASFRPAFHVWSRYSGRPAEEIESLFRMDSDFQAFERGTISPQQFHRSLCQTIGIALTFEEFVHGWNAIYGDAFEAVAACLHALQGRVTVVAFTNTNETHCHIWPERYREVLRYFERIFVSSEMGMRKPEAEAFVYVLRECGVEAQDAVFFDDSEMNVVAAKAEGLRAYLVESPHSISHALAELGLLKRADLPLAS